MLLLNQWTKATKSGGNNTGPNCVECLQFSTGPIAIATAADTALHGGLPRSTEDGDVLVRDSKLGDASPILRFTPAEWAEFVTAVADGLVVVNEDRFLINSRGIDDTFLSFTAGEWDAFRDGCQRGEFSPATV